MSGDGISQTGPVSGDMPAGGGGISVADAAQQALERRYRRLLRCYPPSHRELHQEEMLGVLLATALPGQHAPGAGQTLNLVACGLVIRARRVPGWLAGEPWQDALAVVSLIAPVVMLVIAVLDVAATANSSQPPLAAPLWLDLVKPAAAAILWLAAVLLGLTGRRRPAAAIAFVLLAVTAINLPAQAIGLSPTWFGGIDFWAPITLTNLAACSLAFSPGPRNGMEIVGGRRACLSIAALSGGFGLPVLSLLLPHVASWAGAAVVEFLIVLAVAAGLVITCARGLLNWRVAILAGPAFLSYVAGILSIAVGGTGATVLGVLWFGGATLALIMWPVAIASWRARVKRASRTAAR